MLILLGAINSIYSQTLLLPDSNAVWLFYTTSPLTTGPPVFPYYLIYSRGDTLLDGYIYHKLYLYLNSNNTCYIGGYRNDTLNNKTYVFPNNDTVERLFFDFNVNLNDSVKHKTIFGKNKCIVSNCLMGFPSWISTSVANNGTYDYAECVDISTVTFTSQTNIITKDNKQRKIFTTNSSYYPPIKLIEGIGLSIWNSKLYSTLFPDDYPYGLGCFYVNNNLVFEDTLITQYNGYFFQPCQQKWTGILSKSKEIIHIIVYPNPVSGNTIYFNLNKKIATIQVSLYDVISRYYELKVYDNKILLPDSIADGIYTLQLKLDNEMPVYFKIIKK